MCLYNKGTRCFSLYYPFAHIRFGLWPNSELTDQSILHSIPVRAYVFNYNNNAHIKSSKPVRTERNERCRMPDGPERGIMPSRTGRIRTQNKDCLYRSKNPIRCALRAYSGRTAMIIYFSRKFGPSRLYLCLPFIFYRHQKFYSFFVYSFY